MKHSVTYKQDAPGGYAGTHTFATKRDREAFVERASKRGVGQEWLVLPLLDVKQPVRITAAGLKANPDFAGIVGSVVPPTRPNSNGVAVFFPDRGATSFWMDYEVENVPVATDRRSA